MAVFGNVRRCWRRHAARRTRNGVHRNWRNQCCYFDRDWERLPGFGDEQRTTGVKRLPPHDREGDTTSMIDAIDEGIPA